jgi:hypothetical protein
VHAIAGLCSIEFWCYDPGKLVDSQWRYSQWKLEGISNLRRLSGAAFVTLPVEAGRVFQFNAPVGRGGYMASNDSKVENIQTQFKTLAAAASSLNTASNEFAKSVAILDESLKPLNIGLSVWVPFAFAEVDPPDYDQDEVGYSKVNGTWGLAIRSIRGREGEDFEHVTGPWLFNEAAREMRIHSVEKIPDVIKALTEKASDTTKRIQQKTREVRALAEAIRPITDETTRKPSSVVETLSTAGRLAAEQAKSMSAVIDAVAGDFTKGAK